MASPSELARIVDWDAEFNRPVVDGKFAHPETGEIKEAGRLGFIDGPPNIEIRIFNINSDVKLWNITASKPVSVDDLYLCVARHVHDKIYSLVSVNASAYSFTIVCKVNVTREEFDVAWKNMFSKREDYKHTDEEWDSHMDERFPKAAK